MTVRAAYATLPESSLRVLKRIADHMRTGYHGRLELDMKGGDVCGFREVRSLRPSDMEESDEEILRIAP